MKRLKDLMVALLVAYGAFCLVWLVWEYLSLPIARWIVEGR